jgi:hypothetical protein
VPGLRRAAAVRAQGGHAQIPTDYDHVVADLKRIALYGGGLIAILVALSFFIR